MALGRWGEKQAEAYLNDRGFRLLARNYRNEFGEIDLIVKEEDSLVFVEVKTRRGEQFGYPEEAVNKLKQKHLIECAQGYLQEYDEDELDWRIDVIAIIQGKNGKHQITHFEDAFR